MNAKTMPVQKSSRDTLTLLFLSLCACVVLSDVGNAGAIEPTSRITFENFPIAPITTMAEQVASQRQAEVKKPIYVVNVFRSEKTPIAAVGSMENMCVLVINKNPAGWAAWGEHFKGLNEKQRMSFVNAALVEASENCKNPSAEPTVGKLPKLEVPKTLVKHLDAASAKLANTAGSPANGLFHSAIAMEIRHASPM